MEAIAKRFELIGSRAVITSIAQLPARGVRIGRTFRTIRPAITVDVARDRRGEFFKIGLDLSVDLHVLNVDKVLRHLLLFAVDGEGNKYRYLCGHDERHWFAAAIAGSVSTVDAALHSLKPGKVLDAQAGLSRKERNRRKNRATLRQGEWLFIPVQNLEMDPGLIIRNEPIRRGAGSPHLVEEVYRCGGVTVFVCRKHPNGVDEKTYNRLIAEDSDRRSWDWVPMKRDMEVYGRGKVTHRDHQTIKLNGWHRILANTEAEAWFMADTLVFLD